ncbi:MAG: response regulator [Chloroflexota bacterium]
MDIKLTDQTLKGQRIVVVDDDRDSLTVVELLLSRYGATVHTALDGARGLELIREVHPLFVVADLMMPRMSGVEMIKEARRDPALDDIPFVALSALAIDYQREHALSAGYHGYIVKPLMPESFVWTLLHILQDIPAVAAIVQTVHR